MSVLQEKDKKGNIIKTKDGRSWIFRVPYIKLNGVRDQKKSKRFLTKKIALEEERKFLNSVTTKKQLENDIKEMRFKDLYEAFYKHQKGKVKDTTFDTYIRRISHLQSLDNIKVVDFKYKHFEMWKNEIDVKSLETSTKNDIFKFLKNILNFGSNWLNFDFSEVYKKMSNFTNPNEAPREMDFYTYDEFKQFISFETELKYICLFETLYYMGIRKGELRGLTWDKINFNKGLLRINTQVPSKYGSKEYVFTSVKTKSSVRTLPIPDTLLTHLKTFFEEMKQYSNFNMKWFVFPSKEYGFDFPIASKDIDVRNNSLSILAQIKRIRVHDFRHSCASLLINNGANVTMVAQYLGHTKVEETLNTYSHMFDSALDSVINLINDIGDKAELNYNMTISEAIHKIHDLTKLDNDTEITLDQKNSILTELKYYIKIMEFNLKI